MTVHERIAVGPWQADVAVGSILDVGIVDALVSSDDNYLSHGGGVSLALWRAAGSALEADPAVKHVRGGSRPTVGDVVVTTAGHLPCEMLLHAITLDFDRSTSLDEGGLERLLRNVLSTLQERGGTSLALPLIGTGAARIPVGTCLEALARVLELQPATQPMHVTLVLVEEKDAQRAAAALSAAARARADLVEADGASPRAGVSETLPAVWAAAARRALDSPSSATGLPGDSPLRATAERLLRGTAGDKYAEARALVKWFAGDQNRQSVASADLLPPFAEVGGGDGTRAVRALENLIRVAAAPDDVASLIERLRSAGYRARQDQHVLLEYCASEDPMVLLRELFTGQSLRRLLKDAGDPGEATELPDEVYRRALRRLGFPVPPQLVTPVGLLEHVRSTRSRLTHMELSQLRGEIGRVAADLEVLLSMLLRFYARDAFDAAPEALLVERGQAKHATEVSRATLGSLLGHLRWLSKEIGRQPDARTEDVRAHLAGRPLVPLAADGIPKVRNRWMHGRDTEPWSTLDGRRDLEELSRLVEQTIDHWLAGEWPIFPSVLIIEEVSRDRYGRVRITARCGDGAAEMLFTDIDVSSGGLYLARRLTNPLSVDPVLVALGSSGPEPQ